jgi:hypothetical protein
MFHTPFNFQKFSKIFENTNFSKTFFEISKQQFRKISRKIFRNFRNFSKIDQHYSGANLNNVNNEGKSPLMFGKLFKKS